MLPEPNLTARQQKWFAAVRVGMERETGKSIGEWADVARSCPETGQRARLKWLKDKHGLMQNRAMCVLSEAFGSNASWNEPTSLIDTLWADPAARTILDAIDGATSNHPDIVRTARKGYTAWSRKLQFAAARPLRNGGAILGLSLLPDGSERLSVPRNESWSERLKSRLVLACPGDVDDEVRALLRAAWERS